MIISITGTPGVGKTSVSKYLRDKDYFVVDLHEIINKYNFVTEFDEKRDSKIDAETAANWTCTGICAHQSAMSGGKRINLPDFYNI